MSDSDPIITEMLLVLILIVVIVTGVLCLRQHQKATRVVAHIWRGRKTVSDGDFLQACEIPDEPLPIAVALAARSAIAELGTVPAETIHPDDSFWHDLVHLPFWDSLDWMGFILEVEGQFDGKVILPDGSFIDDAVKLAGGRRTELRVKHLVRATALAAKYCPKETVFDEEV